MQFFPKRVVEIVKKWAPSRQVTFKCPPGIFPSLKLMSTLRHTSHPDTIRYSYVIIIQLYIQDIAINLTYVLLAKIRLAIVETVELKAT